MSNHLKPCPFCGGDASFNNHTDGCYFTVLRKLKADPPADLSRVTDLIEAWNTRTAIQQAESEPVGAREALERIASWSEHPAMLGVDYGSNGVRDYYRKIARDALTHPAPGVPDDVVRDAERYRFIRDADVSDDLIPDIALYAMESLDEYIDAAMLAAK